MPLCQLLRSCVCPQIPIIVTITPLEVDSHPRISSGILCHMDFKGLQYLSSLLGVLRTSLNAHRKLDS